MMLQSKKTKSRIDAFIPEIESGTTLSIYSQTPIHPYQATVQLPSFLSGDWNRMTKLMYSMRSFEAAFIWRLMNQRDNAVIVEGERGEGKTNVMIYLLKRFNEYFGVPFSVSNNIYLGRDVDLSVNFIGEDFRDFPFSSIAVDESEICFSGYRAQSIQNREAKIFMDTFRALKLGVFFVCPDKTALDSRIVDRCNWNIICDWNEIDDRFVEVTVEYYGRSRDRSLFEWLEFEQLIIPYVEEEYYIELDKRKHGELYTESGLRDYHETRGQRLQEGKERREIKRAIRIQEIIDSDMTLNDKIFELFAIPCKNNEVVSNLKDEGATDYRVKKLRQQWLVSKRQVLENVS